MITKQAYLNLAAVDEDFAAEMEKVAINWGGLGTRMRSGLDWLKGKFSRGAPPTPPPPPPPPVNNWGSALKGLGRDAVNYVDQNLQRGVGRAGTFLSNSVTGGQARAGFRQMMGGLNQGGALNQAQFNAGLRNLAAGVGKTGLLYGGAGYGGYRLMRGGNSEPEVARMYHQAMPY